jgi:hypothetical protein
MSWDYFQLVFGDRIRRMRPTVGNHDLSGNRWVIDLVNPVLVGQPVLCAYEEPGWSYQVFGICEDSFLTFEGKTSFTIRDATELDVMEAACGKYSSTENS